MAAFNESVGAMEHGHSLDLDTRERRIVASNANGVPTSNGGVWFLEGSKQLYREGAKVTRGTQLMKSTTDS
jgi:hypothetical protein